MIKTKKKSEKKINENANKIYENRHKFQVGESYSYRDITELCDVKFQKSGNSKNKQLDIFRSLFDIEEYKDKNNKNTTMYKILEHKQLSVIEACEIVENKRGTNPNSWGNKKSEYSEIVIDSLLAELYMMGLFIEDMDRENNIRDNDKYRARQKNIDENCYCIETNKFELSCWAGIRNGENFKNAKKNRVDFCKNLKTNIRSFEYIYPKVNDSIYKATNYILNLLSDTGHVSFKETMDVIIPEFRDDEGYRLSDEEIEENSQKHNFVTVDAYEFDVDLVDKIKILRGDIANKMGYKSLSKIYNNSNQRLIDEFNKRLEEQAKEKYGVIKFYPKVVLYVNKTSIFNYLQMKGYAMDEIREVCTKTFKNHIVNKMLKDRDIINDQSAVASKLEHIAKKHNTDNPFFYYDMVQQMKYYLRDLPRLASALIDPSYKEIEVSDKVEENTKIKYAKKKITFNGVEDVKGTVLVSKTDDELIKAILEL